MNIAKTMRGQDDFLNLGLRDSPDQRPCDGQMKNDDDE